MCPGNCCFSQRCLCTTSLVTSVDERLASVPTRHDRQEKKQKWCVGIRQTDGDVVECDGGDKYDKLGSRLQSYRHWPSWAGVDPSDLARDGFYYTGIRDDVRCVGCDRMLRLWKPGEDVRERHKRNSPSCPFVRLNDRHRARMSESASQQFNCTTLSQSTTAEVVNEMRWEEKRLKTFGRFPLSCSVQPSQFARSGFYFTGKGDSVQCFSCRIVLGRWEIGDEADGEHRRHSPFCPFLNGTDTTNVPLKARVTRNTPNCRSSIPNLHNEQNRLATFKNWPTTCLVSPNDLARAGLFSVGKRDVVCCFHCQVRIGEWLPGDIPIEEHVKYSPDCQFAKAIFQRMQQQHLGALNAEATAEKMKSYEERLQSFRNWSETAYISAESLAEAGFYHCGHGDRVRCFSCGGALKEWQEKDTAWGEHAKHFPSCDFVQQHFRMNSRDEPYRQPSPHAMPFNSLHKSASAKELDFIRHATRMGYPRDLAINIIKQQDVRNLSFGVYLDALIAAQQTTDSATLLGKNQVSTSFQSPDTDDLPGLKTVCESRLCKICMEEELTILFLPCAHILSCEKCASKTKECPVCRTLIERKIHSYFA